MRKTLLAGAAIAVLATLGMAAPAQAHGWQGHHGRGTAQVSVLHAVPNTPVDVYVDHVLTLDDFQPGTLTDALTVPSGRHVIAVTAATATNDSAPIIGPVRVRLSAGDDYTVVAHLAADGSPTATLFQNNNGRIRAGYGLLTVRHVAAAPSVDVLAGGVPVITDLTNPDEEELVLPVGTVSASVALTGTTTPVLGPVDVPITEGVNTIVYAVGSAAGGTLGLAAQTVAMEVRSPAHH